MKPLSKQILAVGFLLTAAILIGGCIYIDGANLKAKFEKAEDRTVPLAPGSEVEVETHNGFIVVQGADTQQCRVEAMIRVRAETDEIARNIAEQTRIGLQESNQKLVIKLDKPKTTEKHSISVDYTITVPRQTHLEAVSHNGRLEFSHLQGNVNCQTHNGKITCNQVDGKVEAETHNGDIHLTAPPNLSAELDVSTHNGSIHSDLPIKIQGEISKSKIKGTIGSGEGKLQLHTHNGSIRIH